MITSNDSHIIWLSGWYNYLNDLLSVTMRTTKEMSSILNWKTKMNSVYMHIISLKTL